MSTLEKNLYKRIIVPGKPQPVKTGTSYRGFSTVNPNTEEYALYDFELVKQDLINHFHIRQGEKLSDPEFGTIIWDLLWEPFTDEVREAILDNVTEICNYDPRLQVTQILVDSYENGIEVNCFLTFIPFNLSEQLQFKFDQANAPID